MAILDDFTAQVVVDGEPLKEYDDDDEETDGDSEDDDITEWRNIFHHASVSKYIESISNARFKIMVKVSPAWEFDSDFISFDLFLDGQYVTNVLCEKGYTDNETIDAVTVSSPTGPLLKQFIFCEIKPSVNGTVDTADSLNKRLNKIGTIAVKVYRVNKIKGKRGKRSKGKSIKELRGMKEVSEENLKGASMTHTTKLGDGEPGEAEFEQECITLNGGYPIAAFKFNYCSKKALQSMLLIPRSPSPVPLGSSSPIGPEAPPLDEMTIEELRALARRQKEMLEKKEVGGIKVEPNIGVKRQIDKVDDEDVRVISSRPARARKSLHTEIIDDGDIRVVRSRPVRCKKSRQTQTIDLA